MHKVVRLALLISIAAVAFSFLMLPLRTFSTHATATIHYVSRDGNCDGAAPCYTSIQAAIDSAASGDVIKVAGGAYTTTGFVIVYITKPLVIEGGYTSTNWLSPDPVRYPTVLDTQNDERRRSVYIDLNSTLPLTVSSFTVQNNLPESPGAIHIITGNVVLTNVRVLSNTNGGIWLAGGSLTLVNSELRSNSGCALRANNANSAVYATSFMSNVGGSIYVSYGDLDLYDSDFVNNSDDGGCGSAVLLHNGNATIQGNREIGNHGTAMRLHDGVFYLRNNIISGTTMAATGGGVHITDATIHLISNVVSYNQVERNPWVSAPNGSGFALRNVTGVISSNILINNVSNHQSQHAISVSAGSFITIAQNYLENNSAGGIWVNDVAQALIDANYLYSNSSKFGAGAYVTGNGIVISENQFVGNTATEQGGGLYAPGISGTIVGNTFESNTALTGDAGAALVAGRGSISLVENRFIDNIASANGGGLNLYGTEAQFVIKGNRFLDNSAGDSGGAISTSHTQIYLQDNMFVGNNAVKYGGAINASSVVTATNNVFAKNSSSWEAIYLNNSLFDAQYTTFYQNGNYALTANASSAVLTNTIVSSHNIGAFLGTNINTYYTLFHNTGTSCMGGAVCLDTFDGDPAFLNPSIDDYRLGPDSDAIDRGIDVGIYVDFEGEPRPMISGYDLGADERNPTFVPTATATSTPTGTYTPTPTSTATSTPTGTYTPTPTSTATSTPTGTYTPTLTPTPIPTSSVTPTVSNSNNTYLPSVKR